MIPKNYSLQIKRLTREFDKSLHRVLPFLAAWLGEEDSRRLIQEAKNEYEELIPRIPDIGRNNPLILVFRPTPQYLAIYRAMKSLGYSIEDAGYLVFVTGSESIEAIPGIARKVVGRLWFSSWFKNRLSRRAVDSQLRQYPGNFVLNYIEGDSQEFDYGIDYFECASCKFLEAEDALELVPYVCAVDKPASDLLGWGLTRTMTLAEGSSKCDFRFKKEGKTNIVLPQSIEAHRPSLVQLST
jgi:hypothetical protein